MELELAEFIEVWTGDRSEAELIRVNKKLIGLLGVVRGAELQGNVLMINRVGEVSSSLQP
jgi:hypothetical protein